MTSALDQYGLLILSTAALFVTRPLSTRLVLTTPALTLVAAALIHTGSWNLLQQASIAFMPALIASDLQDAQVPVLHAAAFSVAPPLLALYFHYSFVWPWYAGACALAIVFYFATRFLKAKIGIGDIIILPGLISVWSLWGLASFGVAIAAWFMLRRNTPLLPITLPSALLLTGLHP